MVFFCFNQIASDCPLGVTACMESRPFRTLSYVRGSPPFPVMKLPALMAVKKKEHLFWSLYGNNNYKRMSQ